MYALIIADTVHELFDAEPVLHPDLHVVDVSGVTGIAFGWTTTDGKTFVPPVALPSPPSVRTVPGPTLVKAATDDAWPKVKARDQACIAGRASVPESLDMIARAAAAMGTTPKAWFDLALGVAG